MLLIGSAALKHNTPGLQRIPKDRDFIADPIQFEGLREEVVGQGFQLIVDTGDHFAFQDGSTPIIEVTRALEGTTDSFLLDMYNARGPKTQVADNETLLWLKESHKYKKNSVHFYKTMQDIHTLRILVGETRPPAWFKQREKETYNYNHPALNVTKEDFFDDSVPYQYDHDSIHKYVAIGRRPAYYEFLVGEVKCSKNKFNSLKYETRLHSVIEESMVLALERSLIPNYFQTEPVKYFLYALMKVCTSITSGWWREFAWENHHNAVKLFMELRNAGFLYEDHIKIAINEKSLKLHETNG